MSDVAIAPDEPRPQRLDARGKPLLTLGYGQGQIAISEKQDEAYGALSGPERFTCLFGGTRSGKTFLVIRAIVMRAVKYPGSRHVCLRYRANAARATIALDTLPKVVKLCFPGLTITEHRQEGYFKLLNGSEIWIGGLDEKERVEKILGSEYSTIFLNEASQIPYSSALLAFTRLAQVAYDSGGSQCQQRAYVDLNPPGKSHWTNQLFGLGIDPQDRKPISNRDDYTRAALNPVDNAHNLDPKFMVGLMALPEKQRRRFFEGVYVDEIDGALWPLETIDLARLDVPHPLTRYDADEFAALGLPTMDRIVVALDPSGVSGPEDTRSDEVGIIVAGKGSDGHGYILADMTCRLSPAGWARRAVDAYHSFKADHIVAERNYGGEMVHAVITNADPNVPYREVTASRGKSVRAEPAAALYEETPVRKGIIHHVGRFPDLEAELANFSQSGYLGDRSPNHADALVWALADLFPVETDTGFIGFYKALSEGAFTNDPTVPEPPKFPVSFPGNEPTQGTVGGFEEIPGMAFLDTFFGGGRKAVAPPRVKLFIKPGISTCYGKQGEKYVPDRDGIIVVTAEDARIFTGQGFQRVP